MNNLFGLPSRITKNIVEDTTTKCWNWTGYKHKGGYGIVKYEGKVTSMHRINYTLFNGEIPENHNVIQTCENKLCCNPEHLTIKANTPKKTASSKRWSFSVNLNDTIVFRDEWSEKEIFGYSEYEIIAIAASSCTVKEKVSGHIYEGIRLTQIRPLILN